MIEVGQFYDFSSTYSDPEVPTPIQTWGEQLGNATEVLSCLALAMLKTMAGDGFVVFFAGLRRAHFCSERRPYIAVRAVASTQTSLETRFHDHIATQTVFHSHAHITNTAVFYDEHEMHLPSGRVAGHRSLKKYYRQNLHSYPTAAERMEQQQRRLENAKKRRVADEDSPTSRGRWPGEVRQA